MIDETHVPVREDALGAVGELDLVSDGVAGVACDAVEKGAELVFRAFDVLNELRVAKVKVAGDVEALVFHRGGVREQGYLVLRKGVNGDAAVSNG